MTSKHRTSHTRHTHPIIKLPRNGGPMICYKHDALIDIIRKRRDIFSKMPAGMCWYQSGCRFENSPDEALLKPGKDSGLFWMFSHAPANLFVSLLTLVKSAKRDGKRMEEAIKKRNKEIDRLERQLEVTLEEYRNLQAQLRGHGITPLKPTETNARILNQKKRK